MAKWKNTAAEGADRGRSFQTKGLLKLIWEKRILYLFILPAIVWYIVFQYVPMGGLLLTMKDYSFKGGIYGSPWAEPLSKYFDIFFNNINFMTIIRNTVLISFLKLLTSFPAPLILALMLNELTNIRFKRMVQTVSYLPFFISWVIVITILNQLLSPYGGPVNTIKTSLFGGDPVFFMGEKDAFLPIVLISNIWKSVGWNSIIYLAAITGINSELYDAGKIDGAGRWRLMWNITLPSISNTIGLLFILAVGGLISAGYDQIYLMRQPGNLQLSQILDTYIVDVGIKQGNYSLATVAGLFQAVVALVLIVITNKVMKKTSDISLW